MNPRHNTPPNPLALGHCLLGCAVQSAPSCCIAVRHLFAACPLLNFTHVLCCICGRVIKPRSACMQACMHSAGGLPTGSRQLACAGRQHLHVDTRGRQRKQGAFDSVRSTGYIEAGPFDYMNQQCPEPGDLQQVPWSALPCRRLCPGCRRFSLEGPGGAQARWRALGAAAPAPLQKHHETNIYRDNSNLWKNGEGTRRD